MHYIKDETKYDELKAQGESVEHLLSSTTISEQEKQQALMNYLNLLQNERAAELGVSFTERMIESVRSAFEAHPTADIAVDLLYSCLLLQQFHSMQFDPWRSHPYIESSRDALTMLEAEGRWSDCMRYCQETANLYAEAHWWPEALTYAIRAHNSVRQLLSKGIKVLENGEMLDMCDSAYAILASALNTAEGITDTITELLSADLGSEEYATVYSEAVDEHEAEPESDPVEMTPEYLAIRYELEEKIDEALEHRRGYYDYCKEYWIIKRMILRSDYNIRWRSPAELNPNEEFH